MLRETPGLRITAIISNRRQCLLVSKGWQTEACRRGRQRLAEGEEGHLMGATTRDRAPVRRRVSPCARETRDICHPKASSHRRRHRMLGHAMCIPSTRDKLFDDRFGNGRYTMNFICSI